jgi:RNA polymerase sigma-32 factor
MPNSRRAKKPVPESGADDEREDSPDEPMELVAADAGPEVDRTFVPGIDSESDSDAGRPAAPGALAPLAAQADVVAPAGLPRDPVARFMAEVRRYPRLSEEEERRLGKAVREAGDMDAARRLVVHNLRLVMSIANHYRRAWANILDLFQEGSVGLMEAVKRWEPSLGPRFGSYAAYWIRAYLLKFLMTNSRLIHVGNTRAGRKLFFRLEKERQKLLAAGFDPTPKLLAAKLDVTEHDLEEVGRHLDSREVSFDPRGTTDSDEGYSLSERIPLEQASPEDSAATAEMSGNLRQVMGEFVDSLTDERERAVWKEHLAAEDPLSLGEIGARFGVSKQRMGQIADKLKKQFRDRVESRMGEGIRADWLGGESD